jgi:hypothetical protein
MPASLSGHQVPAMGLQMAERVPAVACGKSLGDLIPHGYGSFPEEFYNGEHENIMASQIKGIALIVHDAGFNGFVQGFGSDDAAFHRYLKKYSLLEAGQDFPYLLNGISMGRAVAAAPGHIAFGDHAFQPYPRIDQDLGNRNDDSLVRSCFKGAFP